MTAGWRQGPPVALPAGPRSSKGSVVVPSVAAAALAPRMEYLCIAVDVGSNMGPRMSKNLRDTDKASSHLDLALYTLLSMFNRKVSRRCAA